MYQTDCRLVQTHQEALPSTATAKIRVEGNRGVWERDLEDTYAPIAQPTVDKVGICVCAGYFYFEDYSVMDHSDLPPWSWSFYQP